MLPKKRRIENKLSIVFVILLCFVILSIVFFRYLINENDKLSGKTYPNVYIDTINVGNKTKEEILKIFKNEEDLLTKINYYIDFQNRTIATFSAVQLKTTFDTTSIVERSMLIGRSSHFPSKIFQQITALFNLKSYYFKRNIEYDKNVLKEFITNIDDQYSYPAKNALFTFENDKVTSFRKESPGLQILNNEFLQDADKQITSFNKKEQHVRIIINSKVIEPEITLSKSNTFGIEELVAEGKSNYTHSIPERIHNLSLAASKFNGVLIPKNKVFSFNDTVGDISSLTGYKPAYIIKAGKTVLGDGGGVCQVSTTLFRAALNAGLPIIERLAHAYRVGYYENDSKPGFDATVFAPTADLKILNDTPASLLIQIENDKDNNILVFKLYGKKDGRKIEISPVTVYDIQPAPPTLYQDDPTLKKGVQKQVDFAASGAKAIFSYKVTYPNGKIEDKKFFSNYKPWQAVFLNGTAD